MPVHSFSPLRGKVVETWIDSRALQENRLGDPSRRCVQVYVPPSGAGSATRFPLLVYLASFTNSGLKMTSWKAFGENFPQRVGLVEAGKMGPVVVAFPDCFTSLGGNQYVNSMAMGNWEDFLVAELLPRLISEFPVERSAQMRGVLGFSSGGYGALVQGLRHGEQWGGVACHSGDIGFDLLFQPFFPRAAQQLEAHGFQPERFLEDFRARPRLEGCWLETVSLLAMGATYDPDPEQYCGVRLPFDPHTLELIPERWSRWLAHDPLELVDDPLCRRSLSKLRGLYLDCGSRDQYNLQFGARKLGRKLEAYGIEHRYDEFDGSHSGVDCRLDTSLPFLYEALTGARGRRCERGRCRTPEQHCCRRSDPGGSLDGSRAPGHSLHGLRNRRVESSSIREFSPARHSAHLGFQDRADRSERGQGRAR